MDFDLIVNTIPENIMPWLMIAAIMAGVSTVLYIVKRLITAQILKSGRDKAGSRIAILAHAVKTPFSIIILVLDLALLSYLFNYYELKIDGFFAINRTLMQVLLVVALVIFIERILSGLVTRYASSSESLKSSTNILKGVTKIIIIGVGALVILGTMGISVTPIIASLGITSLAVALALQPTLENFFSGVQLVIDKPIRVGDFIELDSGEQGFVEKIGWRSTWIKMLPNNIVIMPNSKLSQSKIINYYYPEKELSVPVEVGVHYDSDLDHVENVTLEVAREILKSHEWGVDDYNAFVIYHTFDNSSINFTVMLRAKEYFNRFFIRSAFIKALHKRYAQEGITIPYPIRAINTSQESPTFSSVGESS